MIEGFSVVLSQLSQFVVQTGEQGGPSLAAFREVPHPAVDFGLPVKSVETFDKTEISTVKYRTRSSEMYPNRTWDDLRKL
jgi:hypothetical protein